ncbi:AraC family transcriptional regulator [Mesorhizobium sp. CN2-181]|uniref:AraC family transcriptional regulator n=1 Tax=Mesorhizobium yinganensis TaxID=3157707 RepID=UPI0032B87FD8
MDQLTKAPFRKVAAVPTTAGLAARLALAALRARAVDPRPLLAQSGLTSAALSGGKRVAAAAQIDFLDLASEAAGDAWFGLSLAETFDLREMGMFYYVAASSHTLGDALRRVERYVCVTNEALVARIQVDSACRVSLSFAGIARHRDRHHLEFLFLVLLRMCRQFVGQRIMPTGASFIHHRSGDLREVERRLGCGVQFGAYSDEMRFDAAVVKLPLVGDDPFLNELMVKSCEEAKTTRTSKPQPFRTVVENAIAPLLPHAEARSKIVAKRLGLSERTFARRLQAEELSFVEILDQLRRDLAVRYIEEPEIQISQIAWLLGFHHPSGMTHACQRWFGKSPLAYRRSLGV